MEIYNKDLGKVCVTPEGNHIESKSYEKLSIVYDPIRRKSYLSKIDVPKGIHIDNTKYWQCIGSGKVNDDCIINLSYVNDNNKLITYTLQEAIDAVYVDDRRAGTLLTFLEKTEDITRQPGWALYQFNSINIDGWNNLNNWFPIYHNRVKFVGWYDSESELKTSTPLPYPGDYAYVGTNYDNSSIYKCKKYGVWVDTNVNVRDYMEIVISGDISINTEGNWTIDGIDTGIKVSGIIDVEGSSKELPYGENPTIQLSLKDVEQEIGKKLVLELGIPAGKPGENVNIKSATANIKMLQVGETPSCKVTVSGSGTTKILHFDFEIPYGGESPIEYVTFTVNSTPSNAKIIINDGETNTVDVPKGSNVSWSVSADGYITKSGSRTIAKDTTIEISLSKENPNEPTYSNLRIVKDDSYVPSNDTN